MDDCSSGMNEVLRTEEDDLALDAMLLAADRLAAQMENWEDQTDDNETRGEESYESSGSFRVNGANESLHVPSLIPTSNTTTDVDYSEYMLRKAGVLLTEMRRSSSAVASQEYTTSLVETNGDYEVDDLLDQAEQLVAKMHSASQTSLDEVDDEEQQEAEEEDGGVLLPPDLDLLMTKLGSELSSGAYSNSADTGVDSQNAIQQTHEILKQMEVATHDDGTATSTSLGSDMAVASRVALRKDDRVGIDHGQQVAKAEEMARLMQAAVSSHMPLDEALLNNSKDNEDLIERVVTALKNTATDDDDDADEEEVVNIMPNAPAAPSSVVQHEEASSAASGSMRSESIRSNSMRSESIRSNSMRSGGVLPPPNPPPPRSNSNVINPPSQSRSDDVALEQLPTEIDPDFVPVADFRPKKLPPQPTGRPNGPASVVANVKMPPPPRPSIISADDDDFVPVADFSSISSSSVTKDMPPTRSVRWERVENPFQEDADFVPVMDFRNAAPKEVNDKPIPKSIPQVKRKPNRRARTRRFIRGMIVVVVAVYLVWRLSLPWRTEGPNSSGHEQIESLLNDTTSVALSPEDLSDADHNATNPDETSTVEEERKRRIIWNYPADICPPEDEVLDSDQTGVCEIVVERIDPQEKITTNTRKRIFRLPGIVCKIPKLGDLLARHCHHDKEKE